MSCYEIQRRENQTQLDALKRKYSELLKEYEKLVALCSIEAYKNAEKESKENGFIRVKPNLPKQKKTNFEKITESVDSLAEFVDNYYWCPYNNKCDCNKYPDCVGCIKEWLQKECE